jgi:hypothetical protein
MAEPPSTCEPGWECPFPPDLGKRTYMMDVDPSDVLDVPDLSGLIRSAEGTEPIDVIPAEGWEACVPGTPPHPGMVFAHLLLVSPGAEVFVGGRTPCREEHAIAVSVDSSSDRSPVVVLPIIAWEEYFPSRRRADAHEALREARWGQVADLLPLLLPRDGYDSEPDLFIWLALPRAMPYRQAVRHHGNRQETIHLRDEYVPRVIAAWARFRTRRRR